MSARTPVELVDRPVDVTHGLAVVGGDRRPIIGPAAE